MGAGGGGFFVCWAPKEMHDKIKESLNIKAWVDVKLSGSGSQVICGMNGMRLWTNYLST